MKKYYICLPSRYYGELDIPALEQKFNLLIKDVTSLYQATFPNWSCGYVYLYIGNYDDILRYLREMCYCNATENDYADLLKEFTM